MCFCESVLWWHGQGVHWINLGFLIYVSMDRKPENGAEIHNDACGRLGIMMWIMSFKSTRNQEDQE